MIFAAFPVCIRHDCISWTSVQQYRSVIHVYVSKMGFNRYNSSILNALSFECVLEILIVVDRASPNTLKEKGFFQCFVGDILF